MRAAKMDFPVRAAPITGHCPRIPWTVTTCGASFVYREIVAPQGSFPRRALSDEQGGLTCHPMSPTRPLNCCRRSGFTEHEGKTTFTIRWSPYNATEVERKPLKTGAKECSRDRTGTLDQLENIPWRRCSA